MYICAHFIPGQAIPAGERRPVGGRYLACGPRSVKAKAGEKFRSGMGETALGVQRRLVRAFTTGRL